MHPFDPDGSVLEYRREKIRQENRQFLVWGVVTVVASVLILAAVDITLSLLQGR
jgi:hypothetical protein